MIERIRINMKKEIIAIAAIAIISGMTLASCGREVDQDSVSVALPKVTVASDEKATTTTGTGTTTTGSKTTATTTSGTGSSTTTTTTETDEEDKDTETTTTTATTKEDDTPATEPTEAPAAQTLNKTSFGTGDLGQSLTSILSNPDIPENVPACIPKGDEGGAVYRYKYGSDLVFDCYSSGGVKYIANIYIYSSSYSLDNGITVGSSKDDVTAAYGEPSDGGGNYMLYSLGDKELYFGMSGDSVSYIQINYI